MDFFRCYKDFSAALTQRGLLDNVKYVAVRSTKNFASDGILSRSQKSLVFFEVRWPSGVLVDFDGIPFMVVGRKVFECSAGRPRHRKSKLPQPQSDHDFSRKYRKVRSTKKLCCPVKLHVYELAKFPDFQIPNSDKSNRRRVSAALKRQLQTDPTRVNVQQWFVTQFPNVSEHNSHYIGPLSQLLMPMHQQVASKVNELVKCGVRRLPEMRKHLQHFVENDVFAGRTPPPQTDARYWPSGRTLLNAIHRAAVSCRSSADDGENIVNLVEQWRSDGLDDEIEFNLSDELTDNRPIFAHQSKWQRRMLTRYGSEVCILDATYNTTCYGLPLLVLSVPTNSGYVVVGMFLLTDEQTSTITKALQLLSEWCPEWQPKCVMSDYLETQIAAVEAVFPSASVVLCKFHRIQAWNRHLINCQHRDAILAMMNQVAEAATDDAFDSALTNLQTSDEWQQSESLHTWFQETWLSQKKKRFSESWLCPARRKKAKKSKQPQYLDTEGEAVAQHLVEEDDTFSLTVDVSGDDVNFCYAPVRDFIPAEFLSSLPDNFLNSAVVSSHEMDTMLREEFAVSFILPNGNTPLQYLSTEPLVKTLKERLPPAIFLAMLEFGLVDHLEGRPPRDSFMEKLMEDLCD